MQLDALALEGLSLHEFSRLPNTPKTDVERRVEHALAWFEQSQLSVAGDRGFTRRAEVRNALDGDSRRVEIEASLLAEDPRLWGKGARLRAG